jgi:hypothetical protein
MLKSMATCIGLAASVLGAAAQSTSPLSTDNRASITAQTHCKDKAGNVWLKSSAQLAGSTDSPSTTGRTPSGENESRPAVPVESAGGPNMAEVARNLPDCP